jgi:glycosyltransferase involved in cell wall biosynthesis
VTISVVIPALDEARNIADAIGSVIGPARPRAPVAASNEAELPNAPAEPVEICVVDGGSRDDTVGRARAAASGRGRPDVGVGAAVDVTVDVTVDVIELADPEPARRVRSRDPGAGPRAHQLQVGLEATTGETVIFLHADTQLPPRWRTAVHRALAAPGVVGGAFRFGFRDVEGSLWQRAALRVVEAGARWRSSRLGLPYGDQALFARRSVLEAAGGVPQVPLMEDLDLVRSLRRRGRVVVVGEIATTSPRRHLEGGVARVAVRHALAAGAWALGVDRRRLARWLGR